MDALSGETKENIDAIKVILMAQGKLINAIGEEIKHLKKKCAKIATLNEFRDQMNKIHNEYLWALVIEQEKLVNGINEEIERNNNGREKLAEKLQVTERNLECLNEDVIIGKQAEVRQKARERTDELDRLKKDIQKHKSNVVSIQMKMKTAAHEVARYESKIDDLSGKLERLKAEREAKDKEEVNKDNEELERLQNEKKSLESSLNSIKGDSDNFQLAADREHEKLDEIERQARAIRGNIEGKKRNIAALSGKSANKYAVFGPKIEQLVAKVEANKHRFKKPPKGPIGACIRVKDPKFAVLVEGVLGKYLDSFLVDNPQDLNLMRNFVSEIYGKDQRSAFQHGGRPSGVFGNKMPSVIMFPYQAHVSDDQFIVCNYLFY